LEHWAPKAYFQNSVPTSFVKLDERKKFNESELLLKEYMDKHTLTKNQILQIGLFQSLGGCKELAYYMADLNPEIYLAWAQKAQQVGNNDQAMEFLQLAMKRSPKMEPIIHKEKAIVLGNKGDFKGALNEISIAIEKDPTSAVLHYQKGTFHLSTNELEAAANSLNKALELDPAMIDAYNNLATVRGKQGNFDEAMKLLDKAILLSGNNPKVFFNRAYAKGMMSDFSGAVDDFSSAINLEPTYSQAYLLRGRAYISLGNRIKACEDFNKARSLNNPNAQQSIDQFCH
jgi:Flp pilus assembly protein TadD